MSDAQKIALAIIAVFVIVRTVQVYMYRRMKKTS